MVEKEYIEREALIAEYDRAHKGPAGGARKLMVEAPAADVAEVKHGEWHETIWKRHNLSKDYQGNPVPQYMCSLCQREEMRKEPYCHCGAKMDGDEDAGSP